MTIIFPYDTYPIFNRQTYIYRSNQNLISTQIIKSQKYYFSKFQEKLFFQEACEIGAKVSELCKLAISNDKHIKFISPFNTNFQKYLRGSVTFSIVNDNIMQTIIQNF